LILGTPPEGYISLCRVISNAKQPSYAAISVPLVIIAGNDDKTAPMEACEEILESYGTSQDSKKIEKIYGVGHWQCVEAPEEVQHYIELFLRSVF
jgi:pimeloyl-ACP methyl ester carboxylesterase